MLASHMVISIWPLLLIPLIPALLILITAAFAFLVGMGVMLWRLGNRRPSS